MAQRNAGNINLLDLGGQTGELLVRIMFYCGATLLALLPQTCSKFNPSLIETAARMKAATNGIALQRSSLARDLWVAETAASNAKKWCTCETGDPTDREAAAIVAPLKAFYACCKAVAMLRQSPSVEEKRDCAELLAKQTHTYDEAAALLRAGAAPLLVQMLRDVSSSREHLPPAALGIRHWSLEALSNIFVHHSPKVGPIAATAVELLVTLLGSECSVEQDHAVIALGCIFRFHGNLRDSIAATAVEPMVTLLKRNCSVCTKVKVAGFFSEMSIYEQHAAAVVHGGAIPYLIEMFTTESTQIAATGVLHNISHFRSLTGEGEKHFLAIVDSCNVSLYRLKEALKLPFTQKVASAIMSQIERPSKRSKLE